jgi:YihY family inner membrane protein
VNAVERVVRRVDAFQQRHTVLAFPFAVFKKFGDDDGGRLAALIAYYGFFSLFPLLLVFISALGFLLSAHDSLREDLIDSALAQFPVIGDAIAARADVDRLEGNWLSIALGSATALWAGLGVAQAAQVAMNTVWDVPRAQWPNFVLRRLRALAMLALLGVMVIASSVTSGFASSGALPTRWLSALSWCIGLVLNAVLFTLAYQILTARDLRWRNVMPGAAVAAFAWTTLQVIGGYYLTHELKNASDVYGAFALVIALFVWISLGAQLALLCAEINVVRHRHLWPRSLVQPPLTEGDREVYASIAERAQMRPEVHVDVTFDREGDTGTDATSTSASRTT